MTSNHTTTPVFSVNSRVLVDTVDYDRPCGLSCDGVHYVQGCHIQLNLSVFFDECFLHSARIDSNVVYIFEGVRVWFTIVDSDFTGTYFCSNYSSIQLKWMLVDVLPTCVHSLGAVKKSDDSLRSLTDCKYPLGCSINAFIDTTCSIFSYLKLDKDAEYMTSNCFFASVDITSAYRHVHIDPKDRQYQGLPQVKLDRLRAHVNNVISKSIASKEELQCLVGHLTQTSIVVRGGKTFSRRLIDAIKHYKDKDRAIVNQSCVKFDLNWWGNFLSSFNGCSKVVQSVVEQRTVETDASMTGFGGVVNDGWFFGTWSKDQPLELGPHWEATSSEFDEKICINVRELWPVIGGVLVGVIR